MFRKKIAILFPEKTITNLGKIPGSVLIHGNKKKSSERRTFQDHRDAQKDSRTKQFHPRNAEECEKRNVTRVYRARHFLLRNFRAHV